MGVEFLYNIRDGEREIIARNVVDFVTATASYARGYVDEGWIRNTTYLPLEQRILANDINTVIIVDYVAEGYGDKYRSPGTVEPHPYLPNTALVALNFDTTFPLDKRAAVSAANQVSIEGIFFHELSHIALGHLPLLSTFLSEGAKDALEFQALELTNATFRDELGLIKRVSYKANLYGLGDGIFSLSNEPPLCFLAGTPVSMWPLDVKPNANGKYNQQEVLTKIWEKPIEEVTPEDWVVSFEEDGSLIPGRVTRTFQNHSKHILDLPVPNTDEYGAFDGTFESLMITPGHATLCAKVEGEDNRFAGKYVPIMDILRSDGAIAKSDGTLVRAATGYPVGSQEDRIIPAVVVDDGDRIVECGHVRLGTSFMAPHGGVMTVKDVINKTGLDLHEDGSLSKLPTYPKHTFVWTFSSRLPKPEDYVLQRSALTLDEIYQADEWEPAFAPQMPAPFRGEAGSSFRRESVLSTKTASDSLPPNIPHSMRNSANQPKMSRKQRRAYEARQKKARKQSVASNGLTVH